MVAVALFKPVIAVWAALNVVDDLSLLFRVARLAQVLLPGGSPRTEMCDVCDDVMGDLLKGSDARGRPLQLGVPACARLYEDV